MQQILKNYARTIYDKYDLEKLNLNLPDRDLVDKDASTKKTKKNGILKYENSEW